MNEIYKIFSTVFYIGYIKWAPGTFGSLFSIIIIVFLYNIINYFEFIILFFILIFLAIIIVGKFLDLIKKHDAKEIIIDEFLGIYLIIIFSNNFNSFNGMFKYLLIFLIFRFFDIIKFFPANLIDKKIKNVYGIILDDLIAGIYTIIILTIINGFI